MESSLVTIATDATQSLNEIWDAMGVQSEERGAYLAGVMGEVREVYTASVRRQCDRRSLLEAEVQGLQTTIEDMQIAMDENVQVPIANGLALMPYRDALEGVRGALQEVWDNRAATLRAREATLFQLYADIGAGIEPGFACTGDRLSLARIGAYEEEIGRLEGIKGERAAAIGEAASAIKEYWEELGFGPRDEYEEAVARGTTAETLGWGTPLIAILHDKVAALASEKAAREEKIMVMGQGITTLWKRLATPEEEQTAFLEAHAGIGDDVISACEKYLSTKQSEFAIRLVELIGSARGAIEGMWKELRLSAGERATAFPGFFSPPTAFNDDLFLAHEAYAAALGGTLEEARPLLRAIEKREALLADKVEYEGIISDPNRLIKGSSSARLREEKLERRVKKELPAYNKKLRAQCAEYEAGKGGGFVFRVDGVRYIDTLDAEEMAEAKQRGDARATREARMKGGVGGAGAGGEEEDHTHHTITAIPSSSSSSISAAAAAAASSSAPNNHHTASTSTSTTAAIASHAIINANTTTSSSSGAAPAPISSSSIAPPIIPRATSNPRASVLAPTKSHAAAIAAGAAARAAIKKPSSSSSSTASSATAATGAISAEEGSEENHGGGSGYHGASSKAASSNATLGSVGVNSRVAPRGAGGKTSILGAGAAAAAAVAAAGSRPVGNKAVGGPPPVSLALPGVGEEALAGAEAILHAL